MSTVYLIHWHEAEAREKARVLKACGHEVMFERLDQSKLRELRQAPPEAFVIDLSRLPAQGLDLALNFRQYKNTRQVPIVFVGGAPEKIDRAKKLLPDACYTTWDKIKGDLKLAIANPPPEPIKARSVFDAYSGTPLIKKLGIKSGLRLALLNAPNDFLAMLGQLPDDLEISEKLSGKFELIIWFVRSQKEYLAGLSKLKKSLAEKSGLWIAWPKKASGVKSDLGEAEVRKIGLANGFVDYKICAVDSTWSGLKFKLR